MRVFLAAAAGFLFVPIAGGNAPPVTIKEPLGIPWRNQVVTVAPAEGWEQLKNPLLIGPSGPQAVQLTSDNRVAFRIASLAPDESKIFQWASGGKNPPAGVSVLEDKGVLTIKNGPLVLLFPAVETKPGSTIVEVHLAEGNRMVSGRLAATAPAKVGREILANGPVFASVRINLHSPEGGVMQATISAAQDDPAIIIRTEATPGAESLSIEFAGPVNPEDPEILSLHRSRTGLQSKALEILRGEPTGYLSPWPGDGWFPNSPACFRIPSPTLGEIQISAIQPGEWVQPKTGFPWKDFLPWDASMIGSMWEDRTAARLPLIVKDSEFHLQIDGRPFLRQLVIAQAVNGDALIETFQLKAGTAHSPVPQLDEVLGMTLAWPETSESPDFLMPMLREPDMAELGAATQSLSEALERSGEIDLMRAGMDVAGWYDLSMRNPGLDPAARQRLRAETARLAYSMAAPLHWSFERGYASGNPNMTVSRTANLGLLALALRNHPMSAKWAAYARDWLANWLRDTVDPSGSWPESSHYARVSVANFIQFALAARQAGLVDFFQDKKFRALTEFYAKTLTPPDPLRLSKETKEPARVTPPYGRGTRGDAWGLDGLLAAGWEASDPARAAMHQWSWMGSGRSLNFSHDTGGQSERVVSPGRPAKAPGWHSEFLPTLGFLWRDRVGEPNENYFLWVTQPPRSVDGEIWPADVGAIAKWFSGGVPIGGSFVRVPETSHPFLTNRVSLAATWDPEAGIPPPPSGYQTNSRLEAGVSFPGWDYGRVKFDITAVEDAVVKMPPNVPAFPPSPTAEPPISWVRQTLLFRPPGSEHAILILRDTVTGGQPTQWQFWSLTNGISASSGNFSDAGPAIQKSSELPGNRFSAKGQFGVDLETYVASPGPGSAFTMRYGTQGDAYGILPFAEFQDLLGLRLPRDGSYFVAMAPRSASAKAAEFHSSKDEKIISIAKDDSVTRIFLSDSPTDSELDGTRFQGTAALAHQQKDSLTLALAGAGSVVVSKESLTADHPVTLQIQGDSATITTNDQWPGGTVTVSPHWKTAPARSQPIQLPPGSQAVSLTRKETR